MYGHPRLLVLLGAETDLWNLIPVSDALLRRAVTLIPLRAGGAIHLATVVDAGETEIWTNDRGRSA